MQFSLSTIEMYISYIIFPTCYYTTTQVRGIKFYLLGVRCSISLNVINSNYFFRVVSLSLKNVSNPFIESINFSIEMKVHFNYLVETRGHNLTHKAIRAHKYLV